MRLTAGSRSPRNPETVSARGYGTPVPTRERRCEVCGCCADLEQTSAHHARVLYLCTWHGKRFHVLEPIWKSTKGVFELLARIDIWLKMHRELARAA